jgi:hypothetical protein
MGLAVWDLSRILVVFNKNWDAPLLIEMLIDLLSLAGLVIKRNISVN